MRRHHVSAAIVALQVGDRDRAREQFHKATRAGGGVLPAMILFVTHYLAWNILPRCPPLRSCHQWILRQRDRLRMRRT